MRSVVLISSWFRVPAELSTESKRENLLSCSSGTYLVTKLLLIFLLSPRWNEGFPGGSVMKNLPAKQEMGVQSLGGEDPLEKEMATHSSVLAWRIPWTEEPGRLQSRGLQRVWHDLATKPHTYIYCIKLYWPLSISFTLQHDKLQILKVIHVKCSIFSTNTLDFKIK